MRWAVAVGLTLVPAFAGCTAPPLVPAGPEPWPGAAHVFGPETSPLPILPLRLNERGEVEGVPAKLPAYQYCARENITALQPGYAGDEVLRYFLHDEWAESFDPWFEDRLGAPVRPEDVPPGEGALVSWRSAGRQGSEVVLAWVLRLNQTPDIAPDLDRAAVQGMLAGGLVAFSASSPYFCCTTGYHVSPIAERMEKWDFLFDTCHFSTYDPGRIVQGRIPPCSSATSQPERYRCPAAP